MLLVMLALFVFWIVLPVLEESTVNSPDRILAYLSWFEGTFLHLHYGFLVLAAWLFGWRSVLILAPVGVLVSAVFDHEMLLRIEVAALYAVLLTSAPTVFSLFRLGTGHAVPFDRLKLHWRFLLSGGVLSAVLCTMLSAVVGDLAGPGSARAATMLGAIAGKIAGLFMAIALIWLIYRTCSLVRRVI